MRNFITIVDTKDLVHNINIDHITDVHEWRNSLNTNSVIKTVNSDIFCGLSAEEILELIKNAL